MKEKLSGNAFAPPMVTVTAENVVIENTDGISSFSDSEIAVRYKGGAIIVSGEGLMILSLEEGYLIIGGKIRAVTFA